MGVIFLGVLVNGMTLMNINEYWQYVVRGGLLLAAVLINRINERSRDRGPGAGPRHVPADGKRGRPYTRVAPTLNVSPWDEMAGAAALAAVFQPPHLRAREAAQASGRTALSSCGILCGALA